jgi:DNA-binding Lrp family transcriptional regulator
MSKPTWLDTHAWLLEHGPAPARDIRAALGLPERTCKDHLYKLERRGMVYKSDGMKNPRGGSPAPLYNARAETVRTREVARKDAPQAPFTRARVPDWHMPKVIKHDLSKLPKGVVRVVEGGHSHGSAPHIDPWHGYCPQRSFDKAESP